MNFSGALFDLDGVIIDTEPLYTLFWGEIGRHHKLPSPTFAYDIKGQTLTHILDSHFPDPRVRADVVDRLHAFEDTMPYNLFPGAREFILSLREKGVKTAVVTSSDKAKMAYLASQHPDFFNWFDAMVIADDVSRSKPDPEGYRLGAARLGLRPEECVVFEDSFQGLQAGRSSGAKIVALSTTNPAERLAPLADVVVGALAELTDETLDNLF